MLNVRLRLMRKTAMWCIVFCSASAAGSPLAPAACTNSTVQATYLYAFSGFSYKTGSAVGTTGASDPFVAAGRLVLYGDGSGLVSQTINTRKEITETADFPVTYSVQPGCTASVDLPLCPSPGCAGMVHLVIAPDGSEGFAVSGIENTVLSGGLLRVSGGSCESGSVAGTYRFHTWGFGQTPNGLTPTATSAAFASAGLTVNSGGTAAATDWMNLGGLIVPRTLSSSVTMDQNCIGAGARNGQVGARLYGTSDGSAYVLIQIIRGAPVVGWYKRQ